MPIEIRSTIISDGYGTRYFELKCLVIFTFNVNLELNVKEIRPPNMDESGRSKYPVIFHPFVIYGRFKQQSSVFANY